MRSLRPWLRQRPVNGGLEAVQTGLIGKVSIREVRIVEKLCYTPAEAAEILSVSRSRIYDLLRRNELESILLGRSRRITAQALDEFVNAQQPAPVL